MRVPIVTLYRNGESLVVNERDRAAWERDGWAEVQDDKPLSEKQQLQEIADSLGLEYDKRWGYEKLRALIAEARED